MDRISTLMNSVLDSTLEKISFNEFVQGDAFREEARKSESHELPDQDIELDEKGNPIQVQKKNK